LPVLLLALLLPILTAIVASAVWTIYLVLFVLGILFYVKNSSIKLTLEERRVLIGFGIVFLIYFLGMINSGLSI
jgi:hypothetical protein